LSQAGTSAKRERKSCFSERACSGAVFLIRDGGREWERTRKRERKKERDREREREREDYTHAKFPSVYYI
jgi:hypothetical protein